MQEADESLNFEEQILEAAKSITAAAHALVKAATVAQRELVKTGRVNSFFERYCYVLSSHNVVSSFTIPKILIIYL